MLPHDRRLKSIGSFIVVLVAACALAACNYSIQKHSAPNIPSPANYSKSELSYNSVYDRVLRSSCVGCHGTGGGINLETYSGVKSNLSKIYQAAIIDRKMPKAPNSPLTSNQLGLLNAWILAGAPETAPGGGPGTIPIPLAPTFSSIKYNILEPKCLMCHAPGKPVARIPLVTMDDLLNSPLDLVIPGNSDESGIVLSVRGANPAKIMPPPKDASGNPTGLAPLPPQEIDIIVQWILNGAKD